MYAAAHPYLFIHFNKTLTQSIQIEDSRETLVGDSRHQLHQGPSARGQKMTCCTQSAPSALKRGGPPSHCMRSRCTMSFSFGKLFQHHLWIRLVNAKSLGLTKWRQAQGNDIQYSPERLCHKYAPTHQPHTSKT